MRMQGWGDSSGCGAGRCPRTLNPPGALTQLGRWSKPTQPSWGPQTPSHRASGLHLAPLLAGSKGRAGGAAEAQAEPRTGQRAWRGRWVDSRALTAGRQGGATRRPRPGKQSPGRSSWAPGGALPPRGGQAGSWEGRKPSWLPATLQPHNGVILPGHRMPFVGQRPAAQPRGRQWREGAGGAGAASQGPLLLLHRRVQGPQSRPPAPGGPRSSQLYTSGHTGRLPRRLWLRTLRAHCLLRGGWRTRWQPCLPLGTWRPCCPRGAQAASLLSQDSSRRAGVPLPRLTRQTDPAAAPCPRLPRTPHPRAHVGPDCSLYLKPNLLWDRAGGEGGPSPSHPTLPEKVHARGNPASWGLGEEEGTLRGHRGKWRLQVARLWGGRWGVPSYLAWLGRLPSARGVVFTIRTQTASAEAWF